MRTIKLKSKKSSQNISTQPPRPTTGEQSQPVRSTAPVHDKPAPPPPPSRLTLGEHQQPRVRKVARGGGRSSGNEPCGATKSLHVSHV